MKRLIKLTDTNVMTFLLNPDKIVSVTQEINYTEIYCDGDAIPYKVIESLNEVMELCNA